MEAVPLNIPARSTWHAQMKIMLEGEIYKGSLEKGKGIKMENYRVAQASALNIRAVPTPTSKTTQLRNVCQNLEGENHVQQNFSNHR